MADSPLSPRAKHQLRTAVSSARNLATTIQISIGSEIVDNGTDPIDVTGIPYLRVYNDTVGAVTLAVVFDPTTNMPLYDLDGTVVSIAAGACQLVDVRGVEHIVPSAAISFSLVV